MRLIPNATLEWHMDLAASVYPGWDAAYASTLVKRFNLRPEQVSRSLSVGEHTKAALVSAAKGRR